MTTNTWLAMILFVLLIGVTNVPWAVVTMLVLLLAHAVGAEIEERLEDRAAKRRLEREAQR